METPGYTGELEPDSEHDHFEFGHGETLELRTNSLGYIFVPMGKAMRALEATWATIPGYRRTKLDYGGLFYKKRMEKAS